MQIGIHLPQYGRAATPDAVGRVAKHAEDLGFAHVWVSDHVIVPAAQDYPSPYLLDPLVTLTWAAATTSTVRLATSVIVAPQHHPLWLAKAYGSLDLLSGGRLTLGLGVGWSQAEYEALDRTFHDRGKRLDEIIEILRRSWTQDPTSFHGEAYDFGEMRVMPKPAHQIPLWIGGSSEAAYRRAVRLGDGFHAIGLDADSAAPLVARLRRDRPDASFEISARTGWDPQGMDHDQIRREHAAWMEAGIGHVVSAPWRSSADDWLRSMDQLATLTGISG
ncbi:MAG: LLM class F420-dependent oxidoreductase [Acidimicrobiia bacterium]